MATHHVAAGGMQHPVPNSIATLRFLLARAIAQQLDRCPACARPAARRVLRHSKSDTLTSLSLRIAAKLGLKYFQQLHVGKKSFMNFS
jgi:hypothetical protein